MLLQFAVQVREVQVELRNEFVCEHPAGADSWTDQCMQRLSKHPRVQDVVLDQCMFWTSGPRL